MALTKEKLINTYIVNDCPVKCDAYVKACGVHGIKPFSPWTLTQSDYKCLECDGEDIYGSNYSRGKQLHLSDLIDLKNSKVYTTDPEVVRMYGELCGRDIDESPSKPTKGWVNGDTYVAHISGFADTSNYDTDDRYHEITEAQVRALYREKFGYTPKPKTRTEYVKVNFDGMHVWECLREFSTRKEEWFYKVSSEKFAPVLEWFNFAECIRNCKPLYRKQEVEVDWRDELTKSLPGFSIEANGQNDIQMAGLYDKSQAVKLARAILVSVGEVE